MQSVHDSAGLRRMSIQEEVAQQELDEVARKNDADFEALLSKVRVGCPLAPDQACAHKYADFEALLSKARAVCPSHA